MNGKPAAQRAVSACEIGRNLKHFETWSTHQSCEQVSFADLPIEVKADVLDVFNVNGKLPKCWVDESSRSYRRMAKLLPSLHRFLCEANFQNPAIFSRDVANDSSSDLSEELSSVFLAWRNLQKRKSSVKSSEADFAANVYNVFRSSAIRESEHRTQCRISLPQHRSRCQLDSSAVRVLRARTVVPDGAIFIRSASLRHLSHSKSSVYKTISSLSRPRLNPGKPSAQAFRFQATPCDRAPPNPGFEFVSSVWEDKKPGCETFESGYRQNRMACTSVLRHLYSFRIQAPIFGLIWADGRVKAHVDWYSLDKERLTIFSAPYPGPAPIGGFKGEETLDTETESEFYEWNLDRPADILAVYLLVRNLDQWTAGRFQQLVESGLQSLMKAVVNHGKAYMPWKHEDTALLPKVKSVVVTNSMSEAENTPPTSVPTSANSTFSSPPRRKNILKDKAQIRYY